MFKNMYIDENALFFKDIECSKYPVVRLDKLIVNSKQETGLQSCHIKQEAVEDGYVKEELLEVKEELLEDEYDSLMSGEVKQEEFTADVSFKEENLEFGNVDFVTEVTSNRIGSNHGNQQQQLRATELIAGYGDELGHQLEEEDYHILKEGRELVARSTDPFPDKTAANQSFLKTIEATREEAPRGDNINHAREKRFRCVLCDKRFFRKGHLSVHIEAHTREKSFPCSHCDQIFKYENWLIIHLGTHKVEKHFQCDDCDQIFNRKTCLIRHIRTHIQERVRHEGHLKKMRNLIKKEETLIKKEETFLCSYCYKGFERKSGLTNHMRSHTRETTFQCCNCNQKFYDQSNLMRHIRTHIRNKRESATKL